MFAKSSDKNLYCIWSEWFFIQFFWASYVGFWKDSEGLIPVGIFIETRRKFTLKLNISITRRFKIINNQAAQVKKLVRYNLILYTLK